MDDFPRHHNPRRRDRRNNHTSANIDVFREQARHIVGARDNVGRQISTDLGNNPSETNKESSSSSRRTLPLPSKGEGIPDVLSVDYFCGGGGDDAEEAEAKLDEWEEENLPIDAIFSFEVTGEIGDVGGHCCPASCD